MPAKALKDSVQSIELSFKLIYSRRLPTLLKARLVAQYIATERPSAVVIV